MEYILEDVVKSLLKVYETMGFVEKSNLPDDLVTQLETLIDIVYGTEAWKP